MRTKFDKNGLNIDLSTGRQKYGVGTGMLVWQGAANGFERGGLNLMPRLAWQNASIARVTFGGLKAEAFYLSARSPNRNRASARSPAPTRATGTRRG